MSQHTPEPWKATLHKTIHPNTKMYWINDYTSIGTEREADALRIVACVNACEGLDTEKLVKAKTPMWLFVKNISEKNAEMLATLYKALPFIEDHEGNKVYKPGAVETMIKEIRAAIAKAEAING